MYLPTIFLDLGVKAAKCWMVLHIAYAVAVLVKIS